MGFEPARAQRPIRILVQQRDRVQHTRAHGVPQRSWALRPAETPFVTLDTLAKALRMQWPSLMELFAIDLRARAYVARQPSLPTLE